MRPTKVSLLFFLGSLLFCHFLIAQPKNMKTIHGKATLEEKGSLHHITASDKSILHWDSFSIGTQETTKFTLPTNTSSVLNRVTQENPSKILGTLESNGQVFLVNPYGIIFGENARINTAAFVASTLDILNNDFLEKSEMLFSGESYASIINYGTIETSYGDVILLGRKIDNQGTITAPQGEVHIATGQEILLKPLDNTRVFIKASTTDDDEKIDVGIENSGRIEAIKTTLQADGNLYELAMHYTGTVDAVSLENRNGEIFLVADDGKIDINGILCTKNKEQNGGNIHIFANVINVLENTLIDVSAKNNGGEILIGADYKGQSIGPKIADHVYVHPEAKITADALEEGNGGKIILWGEKSCIFQGNISTRGGEISGDGGFVEISSHGDLRFQGWVDRRAPNGMAGDLLLDPCDIQIVSGGIGASVPAYVNPYPGVFAGTAQLTNGDLQNGLSGGNVTVSTTAGSGGLGNIRVLASLSSPGAWTNTLTLEADNDVTFETTQQLALQTGPIDVKANGNIRIEAPFLGQAGNNGNVSFTFLTVDTGDFITQDTGYFNWNSPSSISISKNNVYINNAVLITGTTGKFLATANGGHIYINHQMEAQTIDGVNAVLSFQAVNGNVHIGSTNSDTNSYVYSPNGGVINVNCQELYVQGGHTANSHSFIVQDAGANPPTFTIRRNLFVEGGEGTDSRAWIAYNNGTAGLTIAVSSGESLGNVHIQGGSGADASAYIKRENGTTAASTLTISGGYIEIIGGAAEGTGQGLAYIQSTTSEGDMLVSTSYTGSELSSGIQILGGTSSGANSAYIMKTGTTGDVTVSVNAAGSLVVQGDSSSAFISNNVTTGNLNVTAYDNIDIIGGNVSSGGSASISGAMSTGDLTVATANGYIKIEANQGVANVTMNDTDNNGDLRVQAAEELLIYGGTEAGINGYIEKTGKTDPADGGTIYATGHDGVTIEARQGSAYIFLQTINDSNSTLYVYSTDEPVHLLGGTASSGSAYIHSRTTGGQLTVQSGESNVLIEANAGLAYVLMDNNFPQGFSSQGNPDDIQIRGYTGVDIYGGYPAAASVRKEYIDVDGATAGGHIRIETGSPATSNCLIQAREGNAYVLLSTNSRPLLPSYYPSDIRLDISGNIQILGGNTSTAAAYLDHIGSLGSISIITTSGNNGSFTLEANSGPAYAQMSHPDNEDLFNCLIDGDIYITGGSTSTAAAYLAKADGAFPAFTDIPAGGLYVSSREQSVTLEANTAPAFILSSTSGDGYLTVDAEIDLHLIGGTDETTSCDAYISKDSSNASGSGGFNITCHTGDLYLEANKGSAYLYHDVDGASLINVANNIRLVGGTVHTADAYIEKFVRGVNNDCRIYSQTNGDLFLEGNYGYAQILMQGDQQTGNGDLYISMNDHDVYMQGGENPSSATDAYASIRYRDIPSGDVKLTDVRNLYITGGSGSGLCFATVYVSGQNAIPLDVDTSADAILQGGEGDHASARILNTSDGDTGIIIGGNLKLAGGDGGNLIIENAGPTSREADAMLLTTQGGSLSVTVGKDVTMHGGDGGNCTATASLANTSGTGDASAWMYAEGGGNLALQATGNLTMTAGKGGSATAINTVGAFTCTAEARAGAFISTFNGGALSIDLNNYDIHMKAGAGGNVSITDNALGTTSATAEAIAQISSRAAAITFNDIINVSMTGSSGGNEINTALGATTSNSSSEAIILASNPGSSINLPMAGNLTMKAGTGNISNVLIKVDTGGNLFCDCGGNVDLHGGSAALSGEAGIYAIFDGAGTLTVNGQNVTLYGGLGNGTGINGAFIQSDNSLLPAIVNNTTVHARAGHVTLEGGKDNFSKARIESKNPGNHTVQIRAYNDILLNDRSYVNSEASGTTTLICDDQFPIPPFYGNNKFVLKSTASITAAGILRIFTSQRPLNVIETTINGFVFVASPAPDDQEQWPVWWPNAYWGGNGFVLFYKVGDLGPETPNDYVRFWMNQILVALANTPKMFVIKPYEKYIAMNREFIVKHKQVKPATRSFNFNETTQESIMTEEHRAWMQKSWLDESNPYNPTTMNHF